MAVQTTYGTNIAAAVAGMVANSELANVISRVLQHAVVGFGVGVFQGTADNQVTPDGDGRKFRGVTVLDPTVRPELTDQFAVGDTVPVMTKGVIWVTVVGSVVAGAAAYVGDDGEFSSAASGNTAIPNAIWDSSAANGELAKLRLA